MLLIPILALATATLTVTVCKAKVTKPLRDVLTRVAFIRELMSCLYCSSHWAAALLVGLSRPRLGTGSLPVDLLTSWLAVVALSSIAMFMINWSHGSMQWSDDGH